ncbi:UNVERIFIED_CONTAM: hypothetical protein Sradi_4873000 [Sesamum radiatum]|uniref:Chromo domain-containing protein n=1 Tax=Sesamum radiatum TaxID=300843 RepID=A0AAW2N2J0_SESRA
MVTLLAHRYYWPRMEEDVEAYVRTCLVCQLDKVERKKEAGLLQPLPIPEVPWQSISMDFISGFPKVNGNNQRRPHEISIQKTGGKCPAAYRFARSKQELLDEAKDSLAKAQCRLKKYTDMGRRHVEFGVGDQVLLKLTPQIWKKISSKFIHRRLIPKYDGPFEDLLDTARQQTQRAPPVIRKQFEKTVLKILDHRTMGQSKKNRRTDYLVHWSGESQADATWEWDVTLWQFEEKLDEYWVVREGVTPPTRALGSFGGGGL